MAQLAAERLRAERLRAERLRAERLRAERLRAERRTVLVPPELRAARSWAMGPAAECPAAARPAEGTAGTLSPVPERVSWRRLS
jgi:hypothetical protein